MMATWLMASFGLAAFYLTEAIVTRSVRPAVHAVAHALGFALALHLMVSP